MARSRRRFSRRVQFAYGIVGLIVVAFVAIGWLAHLTPQQLIVLVTLGISIILLIAHVGWEEQKRYRRRRGFLDLNPTEFEEWVKVLLKDLGWHQVRRVGGSGDRGVDVWAVRNNERYIIQCKHYKGKVLPKEVRELIGTRHIQKADRAILVTSGNFTDQGRMEAQKQPVELWDGDMLVQRMQEADDLKRGRSYGWRSLQRVLFYSSLLLLNVLVVLWAVLMPMPS